MFERKRLTTKPPGNVLLQRHCWQTTGQDLVIIKPRFLCKINADNSTHKHEHRKLVPTFISTSEVPAARRNRDSANKWLKTTSGQLLTVGNSLNTTSNEESRSELHFDRYRSLHRFTQHHCIKLTVDQILNRVQPTNWHISSRTSLGKKHNSARIRK